MQPRDVQAPTGSDAPVNWNSERLRRERFKQQLIGQLFRLQGKLPDTASSQDWYMALVRTLRDRLLPSWIATDTAQPHAPQAVVLSSQPVHSLALEQSIQWLGMSSLVQLVLTELGVDWPTLIRSERLPFDGDRSSDVLMDRLQTFTHQGRSAIGYGIRYETGFFRQEVQAGRQLEVICQPGNRALWERLRPELAVEVSMGGHTEPYLDDQGRFRVHWHPQSTIRAVPYDFPVIGYQPELVNTLRLWSIESIQWVGEPWGGEQGVGEPWSSEPWSSEPPGGMMPFGTGDSSDRSSSLAHPLSLTDVDYSARLLRVDRAALPIASPSLPNPESASVQSASLVDEILRLQQQFFYISCSLQDIIRRHRLGTLPPECDSQSSSRDLSDERSLENSSRKPCDRYQPLETLPQSVCLHLTDAQTVIAVSELLRLLLDQHCLDWDSAWLITQQTIAFAHPVSLASVTHHWSIDSFETVLPRHLELIDEINRRWLADRATLTVATEADEDSLLPPAIIAENGCRYIETRHLIAVSSREFAPPTALVAQGLEGILAGLLNQLPLATLISDEIGSDWMQQPSHLTQLAISARDPSLQHRWRSVNDGMKQELAQLLATHTDQTIDPDSLLDVHIAPISLRHRQLLHLFYVLTLYHRLLLNPDADILPRTVIFAGYAQTGQPQTSPLPSGSAQTRSAQTRSAQTGSGQTGSVQVERAQATHYFAQLLVQFIRAVAEIVNHNPVSRDRLKVIFLPNSSSTLIQQLQAATDISEQLIAAHHADLTSATTYLRLKTALTGGITISAPNSRDLQLQEQLETTHWFSFGLTIDDIRILQQTDYHPWHFYQSHSELQAVVDRVASGEFARGDAALFKPLIDEILGRDDDFLLADYPFYVACQDHVADLYRDRAAWTERSILTVAHLGRLFNSSLANL